MRKLSLSRWLFVILWMGVIFLGSSASNPYKVLPSKWTSRCIQTIHWDGLGQLICQDDVVGNLSHILEYTVLSFLFTHAFDFPAGKIESRGMKILLFAFIATALYGLSDELHQLFVPGRAFQFLDLCLDLTGATLGVVLFRIIRFRKPL